MKTLTIRRGGIRWGLVLAAMLTAGWGLEARAADLAWKFSKGQVLRYQFSQTNALKVVTQGQDLESMSKVVLDVTWTVQEVGADGSAQIEQTVDRVQANLEVGSQSVTYDSKNDGERKDEDAVNDPAETLRSFYSIATTHPYKLTLNRQGELESAEVPSKLADMIREYRFQPLADTGSILSEEGMRRMLAQFFPKLPEMAVEPGSTWNRTLDLSTGELNLTFQTHYTLESAGPSEAKIRGTIETVLKPRPSAPVTPKIKSQKASAEFTFNPADGCLEQSQASQAIEVEAQAEGRPSQTTTVSLNFSAKRLAEGP